MVRTTVPNFVLGCLWMLFGATGVPEINQLKAWKYLSLQRSAVTEGSADHKRESHRIILD
jgi:hypothetical protein